VFERMRVAVGRHVLIQPRLLSAAEARFLRKAVLELTQEKLAAHMGIHTITVADWERGERSLSREHDYELRGIALSRLLPRLPTADRKELAALLADVATILVAPRATQAPKRTKPYHISASHLMAA
jgi:transcriptional regulator with XRE-family HTH domain